MSPRSSQRDKLKKGAVCENIYTFTIKMTKSKNFIEGNMLSKIRRRSINIKGDFTY